MTDILQALNRLDPSDDSQWTGDGLPRLDVVERLAGRRGIKRQEVTEADAEFTRDTAAARLREEMERSESEATEAEQAEGSSTEETELEALQKRLDKARDAHRLAKAELANAQRAMDGYITRQAWSQPRQSSTASIQHYLGKQRELRDQKVRHQQVVDQKLKEAGIDAATSTKSPLDQAMGRKTGFGQQRPQVPQQRGE